MHARIVLRSSVPAWGIAVLYVLTHAVIIGLNPDTPHSRASDVLGLIGITAGAALVVLDAAARMSRGRALAVIATTTLTTIAVERTLPATADLGFVGWHFGALTFLLLAMTLRGRSGLAWTGMGAMALVTLVWVLHAEASPLLAGQLLIRHIGTLLVGTIVAAGLARMARRLDRMRAASLERERADSSAAIARHERRARIDRVLERTTPVLEAIAADGPIGPEDRTRARVLEAALRDEIRVPQLVRRADFVEALEQARREGREVLLLDDVAEAPGTRHARDVLTKQMAPILREVRDPRMTIRFSGAPEQDGGRGPGRYRLTLVSDSRDEVLVLGGEGAAGR